MQIKEYEALTLKECLQQVRNDLGPEAVILETRKFRKGGLLGWGAREAICIVAATGITVQNDLSESHSAASSTVTAPASAAAAAHYRRQATPPQPAPRAVPSARSVPPTASEAVPVRNGAAKAATLEASSVNVHNGVSKATAVKTKAVPNDAGENGVSDHFAHLAHAMREIKESLVALQQEQREAQERTVNAVVSMVAPTVASVNRAVVVEPETPPVRFPQLRARLLTSGVAETLADELLDALPDFDAWSPQAQEPLAEAALRDLIAHRIACAGPIVLTPGRLKAIALIGPTGVGKTTTIAKLAAHFALVERKRVALLTVDTYRIAAVEQLKTYSQIIDIPIGVAYSQAEVLPAVEQFADQDLLLIDTAGRSQKNVMQVGELKTLLETVHCETHLALSASIKEQDMLDAAQRFSAARVDRILFSKLDETSTYGTLLNVADRTGIPLSYLTTGQKVPEDIEVAESVKLAGLILSDVVRA